LSLQDRDVIADVIAVLQSGTINLTRNFDTLTKELARRLNLHEEIGRKLLGEVTGAMSSADLLRIVNYRVILLEGSPELYRQVIEAHLARRRSRSLHPAGTRRESFGELVTDMRRLQPWPEYATATG
jgi:hypothetical protein